MEEYKENKVQSNIKDILPVQNFLFQEKQFKIYGTNENPLFLVNDIVCDLLGHKYITDNQFFRDNKNDSFVIITREITSELYERFKYTRQDALYFFSEKGLYKCLMRSNKPIAEQFHGFIKEYLQSKRDELVNKSLIDICQTQSTKLEEAKKVIQSFEQYKNILSVSQFLFQESNIRIQGTNEDPLFHCLDVVQILGCEQANHNKFYKQNKKNSEFIKSVTIGHGTKTDNYFTETGLYECLFASDSLIAKQFRREIIQLLKNIRLGVVGLQILDQQQYKQQIDEKEFLLVQRDQQIQEYTKRLVDLGDQIESLQEDIQQKQQSLSTNTQLKTCFLYKEYVYDQNGQVIGIYGGSTIQKPEIRDYQHRSNSCNPGLRNALSQGKTVLFEVSEQFQYINENDRKRKERDLILGIEQSKRLNIQIPRVR